VWHVDDLAMCHLFFLFEDTIHINWLWQTAVLLHIVDVKELQVVRMCCQQQQQNSRAARLSELEVPVLCLSAV
jgi:hypothetical protein